jgi:serine phosphatase RsbU (regulator of sigma subunit)
VYAVAHPGPRGIDLVLCLAGHHPPLVLRERQGRRTVEPVGVFGTAVGLLEEPELRDARIRLEPGDTVCLFTDGLVEARDGAALFDADGVTQVLLSRGADSPGELADALVEAARAFHHAPQLSDDLAILVLRAEPSSSTQP